MWILKNIQDKVGECVCVWGESCHSVSLKLKLYTWKKTYMCAIKHMQKAAQKTIMVSDIAMKRKILCQLWLVVWSCSEKKPKQQAACEIRNGWMPKLKTKKKKKRLNKVQVLLFWFFFRFTLPFLCKHENRDKSHQDKCRAAGNFKNQGLHTLQNSTLLIFILLWHLSAEERKEAVSEEEREKDQKVSRGKMKIRAEKHPLERRKKWHTRIHLTALMHC